MKRTFLTLLVPAFLIAGCQSPDASSETKAFSTIDGEAQGTTYFIKYLNPDSILISKASVDSILKVIDQSLSTWVEGSTISTFNKLDSIEVVDPHFITIYERGKELSTLTGGAFHPLVAPLVRAWGFGPEGGRLKDGMDIDSLRLLVSFDKITETLLDHKDGFFFKKEAGVQIDVNAYAQGYSVDLIADYLVARGIRDMMVEVGGEVVARGLNESGKPWRIGVDKPVDLGLERELQAAVALTDGALATSGTYRKFYEKDGKKYSHTIDPSTGYPVDHNLLSATVLAPNCTNADAMATAFLVMGLEATKDFLRKHPELNLQVYLIYDAGAEGLATYTSEGWTESVEEF